MGVELGGVARSDGNGPRESREMEPELACVLYIHRLVLSFFSDADHKRRMVGWIFSFMPYARLFELFSMWSLREVTTHHNVVAMCYVYPLCI